jgi:hypothetical protein
MERFAAPHLRLEKEPPAAGTLLRHIEPAVIFGGLDEVADSQLLAFLAPPALAAHGIEDVVEETGPLWADVLIQIDLLRRDLVSPAQLVDQLNRIVAVDAELVKGLLRRNAALGSAGPLGDQGDHFLFG